MATIIKPKRSEVASSVPSSGDLAVGEIAINSADKKIYTKQADGTVVDLLSGAGSIIADDTDTSGTVSTIKFADTSTALMEIDTTTESGTAIVKVTVNADQDYGLISQAVGDFNSIDYGALS